MESIKGSIDFWAHHDELAARQTARQIIHLLDRFIPEACQREAQAYVMEVAFKEGFELTSKLMRKEYEQWKKLQLDAFGLSSHSAKPE